MPPHPSEVGETSGTTSSAGLATSPPPAGPKYHLLGDRPEYLTPYLNEFAKLVNKKNLEDFDGSTLGELIGAMQFNVIHLGCMTTYYKAKVGRYNRKMKEDIQSAKSKANAVEKKTGDLNIENLKLIEQASLAQAKAITLEEELNKVKEDLETQKVSYETQLKSLCTFH